MGKIQIFTGRGHGKSLAALGEAVTQAARGKRVAIIQFLKGNGLVESELERRLEPEIKLFRFEKSDCDFMKLSKEKQEEEIRNILNGLNYAKKVLTIGEYDLVILDEVLGLVDNAIVEEQSLISVLEARGDDTDVILTGICMSDKLCELADSVSRIESIK